MKPTRDSDYFSTRIDRRLLLAEACLSAYHAKYAKRPRHHTIHRKLDASDLTFRKLWGLDKPTV